MIAPQAFLHHQAFMMTCHDPGKVSVLHCDITKILSLELCLSTPLKSGAMMDFSHFSVVH